MTSEQRQRIEQLLDEGRWSSAEIAQQVGVPRQTVAAVKAWRTMRSLPPEEPAPSDAAPPEGAGKSQLFGLERDLQIALRANIAQLEPGLEIIDEGTEQSVDAGRVDILAKDAQGRIVVIELKAGAASDDVVAQVLAYMSCYAAEGEQVRGIVVAGDFPRRVLFAARAVPNLELRRYTFQFGFEPVS